MDDFDAKSHLCNTIDIKRDKGLHMKRESKVLGGS